MKLRWHWPVTLCGVLLACVCRVVVCAEEPGAKAVPDPAVEQAIDEALNTDKAIAYPAIKKLSEFGGAARRALDNRLYAEKTQRGRVQLAEIIARSCDGRVAYRITLELSPEGSGKLRLESDRTMLAECARKFDKINGNPATVYDEEELRRNPYGRGDLAKHMEGGMKYVLGESTSRDGRIIASGEIAFGNFDEFATFATSFDRSGYHMLNGITLADNNNLRTLHFKKNADQNQSAARYLLLFHDVKWEFVLDFKGQIQNSNATSMTRNKHTWTFNCAQMLTGEAEIEASFDARQALAAGQANPANAASGAAAANAAAHANDPAAIVASRVVSVMLGRRDDNGVPMTRGPDYEVLLDGRQSSPAGPELHYQWVQTAGIPLNLPKERIAIPVIKMLIYQAGEYRFELTVSKDDKISAPSEVLVLVGDGMKPEVPAKIAANPGAGQGAVGSTQSQIEMPFKGGEQPRRGSAQSGGNSEKGQPAVVDASGNRIELNLIQQVEEEYRRNLAAGGSSVNIVVPNSIGAPQMAAVKHVERVAVAQVRDLPVPPIPVIPPNALNGQPSETVASNENSVSEIRRAEAEFNRVKNAPKVLQPVAPPVVPAVVTPVAPAVVKPVAVAPVVVPNIAPPVAPAISSLNGNMGKPAAATVPAVAPIPVIPPVPIEPEHAAIKEAQPAPVVALKKDNPKQELKDFESALKDTGKDAGKKIESAPPAPAVQVAPVVPATSVAGAGNTLEQGLALMKAGKYAAAVETFKRANQAKPNEDAQVQQGIAMLYAAEKTDGYDRSGTFDAVTLFEEILAHNPKNVTAIMYYGHAQARLENMQQAVQIYREGSKLGGDAVRWESMWQLGNKSNKGKDYEMALTMLKDAEETANKAKVKDVRLERDFAVAYHGAKRDDEAIKRANNVLALGYALDPQLAAELKLSNATPGVQAVVVAPGAPGVAVVAIPNKSVEPKVAVVKPVAAVAVQANPTSVVPAVTPKANESGKSDMEKRFDELANGKSNVAAADKIKTEAVPVVPKTPTAKEALPIPPVPIEAELPKRAGIAPVTPEVVKPEVKKVPEPVKAAPTKTVAELEEEAKKLMGGASASAAAKPAKTGSALPLDVKPARVPKKLPPVPEKYEDAMSAAKRALDRGMKLAGQKDEALKTQVQDAWDEAEAMLRGAWNVKASDKEKEVLEQFTALSKHVGAIALVSSLSVSAKKNGLVILNAEPSSLIFPEGKQLFYAWEQVEGPELDLRRENLTSKKLGLKIKDPGVYKFELVVSDGVRGGNPVTVTVEVRDSGQ